MHEPYVFKAISNFFDSALRAVDERCHPVQVGHAVARRVGIEPALTRET